jgi:hypothetical protein
VSRKSVRAANGGDTPPAYFARVESEASERWDKLDADPPLAGPWRQLFSQVQSPRHVLSELLQNADDAGASAAKVSITGGFFEFEHDGSDFTADQFQSLCRFGFSNKRTLHTIGFRGVGFKSTFSLGRSVEVRTPTLAARFDKVRFTQPIWIAGGLTPKGTLIRVKIEDKLREQALLQNLQEWVDSPASMLFFNSLRKLDVNGVVVERRVIGKGPVPNSTVELLAARKSHHVIVARSEAEELPPDAIDEIQRERGSQEAKLPPCRVELVLGLPEPQRLYVVLPTGVTPKLPFSCNAPFVQDPARMLIKDPSVSPTNRWLLDRLGTLAANVLKQWLAADDIPRRERALAYSLLPAPADEAPGLAASVASLVQDAFADEIDEDAILLTADGNLAAACSCVAPPPALYDVWDPESLIDMFGQDGDSLLAQEVNELQRDQLVAWGWLETLAPSSVIEWLGRNAQPPRPDSLDAIARLWQFVEEHVRYDSWGFLRRPLAIVPVADKDTLVAASRVVRLGSGRRNIRPEDWSFLLDQVDIIDDAWIKYLDSDPGKPSPESETNREACREVLKSTGLAESTPLGDVLQQAAASLFSAQSVPMADCVRIAHVLASLDVEAPRALQYVTRENQGHPIDSGIVLDDPDLKALVPDEWAESRMLHPAYAETSEVCTAAQWNEWANSPKSGLKQFGALSQTEDSIRSRRILEQRLSKRDVLRPRAYRYSRENFTWKDFDFDPLLVNHWEDRSTSESEVWKQIAERLLRGPASEWQAFLRASVNECGNTYTLTLQCDPIPASWIHRFRSLPCLPDTHGRPHVPAELLIRTPDTEPLIGVERFVAADLDREETKPLLRLLGCRGTPAGTGPLVERIRALSQTTTPPLRELGKWYDALDRVVGRRRPDDLAKLKEIFATERLILSDQGEWVTSSEVFQRATADDHPGSLVLHEDFGSLAMWAVIGVADRPSPDKLLEWLKGLESGARLDAPSQRRLRSILPQFPQRVWDECGHWLSLDGTWAPTTTLDLVIFDEAALRVRELFPAIRRRTADGRSLVPDVHTLAMWSGLRNLGRFIENRVKRKQSDLPPPACKPWMRVAGLALARIERPDPDQQAMIRSAGRRLAQSLWQSFRVLGVTPYLDGTPAGQDHEPDVLWDDTILYVREGSLAKMLEKVVAELGRQFPEESVHAALRSCFERDEAFVTDYLASHFTLADGDVAGDAQLADPATAASLEATTSGEGLEEAEASPDPDERHGQAPTSLDDHGFDAPMMAPEPLVDAGVGTGVPEPARQRRDRHPRESGDQATLIARFAALRGFRWDGGRGLYSHADGSHLAESEGMFPWEHRRGEHVVARYWLTEQCLGRGGVEVGADLWEMLRKAPQTSAIVLLDESGHPCSFLGSEILEMEREQLLTVHPAKYRLRQEPTA